MARSTDMSMTCCEEMLEVEVLLTSLKRARANYILRLRDQGTRNVSRSCVIFTDENLESERKIIQYGNVRKPEAQ